MEGPRLAIGDGVDGIEEEADKPRAEDLIRSCGEWTGREALGWQPGEHLGCEREGVGDVDVREDSKDELIGDGGDALRRYDEVASDIAHADSGGGPRCHDAIASVMLAHGPHKLGGFFGVSIEKGGPLAEGERCGGCRLPFRGVGVGDERERRAGGAEGSVGGARREDLKEAPSDKSDDDATRLVEELGFIEPSYVINGGARRRDVGGGGEDVQRVVGGGVDVR